MTAEPIPEGFALDERHSAFTRHNGPYYAKGDGARAVRVLDRHLNGAGVVHGGMLAGFMDSVLAQAVARATGRAGFTVRLVADFVGPAKRGDWLEGQARVIRQTRTLAFAEGSLSVGGRQVMSATGVFRLSRRAAK